MLGTALRKICGKMVHGLGVDLGTVNTLVYSRKRGIVANQPSVVAFRDKKHICAIGEAAKELLGRASDDIDVVMPIEDGVVANARAVEGMLHYLVHRAHGNARLMKPYGIVCVPTHATDVERRATYEIAERADLYTVQLVDEVMAAALGAGIDVMNPRGLMVVDIGGGTTQAAIISMGGIVTAESTHTAGKAFDRKIIQYVKDSRNIVLGQQTAEFVKIAVGTAQPNGAHLKTAVRGRSLKDGLPKTIELDEHEIFEAIRGPIEEIIAMIKRVLATAPPELSSDILDSGITLVGGGALLRKLDQTIAKHTGTPVSVAEDPLSCAVQGTGKIMNSYDKYKVLLKDPLDEALN